MTDYFVPPLLDLTSPRTTTSTWNGGFLMEVFVSIHLITKRSVPPCAQYNQYDAVLLTYHPQLLGHFEHLHTSQLSCTIFADSRTLITSGSDCTISVWSFQASSKSVDLQPQAYLFGHRTPVSVLAVSRSFSTLLSASLDGQIMLWDLNKHRFIRALPAAGPVDVGKSVLFARYILTYSSTTVRQNQ
jgi:WD40 repeat protein